MGSTFSKAFAGLDKANALLKAGKHDRAAAQYGRIAQRLECCAGVRYNHGLALAAAGRTRDAALQFELALDDCANCHRAAEMLHRCYIDLGRQEDADALRTLWGPDQDQEDQTPP